MPTRILPPLAAIRVFEAAARHANFTRAADELGMTQAAVSYQIKVLEDRVGAPLFVRRARGVALSEIGARLLPPSTEAFVILSEAFISAQIRTQESLAISVVPTFATNLLAARLGKFQIENPDIATRIQLSDVSVDFARHEFDLGIRSGTGDWTGLHAHLLFGSQFTPMLSPQLAATIGGLSSPADLEKLPLIDPTDRWWNIWLEAAGVANADPKIGPSGGMGSQVMEANAAIAGQGVAMLTPAFYRDAVRQNQLIQPFDILSDTGWAYWIVYPENRKNSVKIRKFVDWLVAETAEFR